MNVINVIFPYKWEQVWVFDDERAELEKEPFVSGADDILDLLTTDIPDAEAGFKLTFAATPFPGYEACVEWRREEHGGNWYFAPIYEAEGWLCPALMKYFEYVPAKIYAKAEPKAKKA